MAIAWPVFMPQYPAVDGFSETERSTIESFQPEKGPAITGPALSDAGSEMAFKFVVTVSTYQLFVEWWRNTVNGAKPFQIYHPVALTPIVARPISGYSAELIGAGDHVAISLQLERLP